MDDKRDKKRFTCYASVKVNGVEGFIRNLSKSGFKMICLRTLSLGDGKTAEIVIAPEAELGIGEIRIQARQQWHRFTGEFSYGFHIMEHQDDSSKHNFEKLLKVYDKALAS